MSVSTPAAPHTRSIPAGDGTAPDTSDGWTKIDAPMMVPTTMAVARPRPMAWRRSFTAARGPDTLSFRAEARRAAGARLRADEESRSSRTRGPLRGGARFLDYGPPGLRS